MELKPGYKQTEVGVIPEEWEVASIGNVMRLINGRAFKPEHWRRHGTPIIRIQNLNDPDGAFNYCDTSIEEKHRVNKGDVLFAWSGTTGTSFGARIWNGPPGILNQHIFKVHADPQILTSIYSFLILQRVQDDIEKQAHGFKASFVHVKKSDLVKIFLPVPPLHEQRAIAEALSDVDALLGGLDRLIAKKRDLKQAAMQQLLTGQTRLPGFSGSWDVVQLGSIANPNRRWSFTGGPFGSNLKSSDYTDNGIRIIQLQNIGDGTFNDEYEIYTSVAKADELISCNIYPSEIILSKMGDPVARACIIPQRHHRYLMCSDGIRLAVDPSRFDTNFVFFQINAPDFRNRAANSGTGSTRKRIGLGELRSLVLSCPTVAEQSAIAAVLSDMDAELAALERRRDKTRALKQAMMQELLTGRTRLLKPQAAPA